MLSKLKARTDLFEFFEYDSIKPDRDGFLLSSENLDLIEEKWMAVFTEDVDWHHPNEFMDYINCYFVPYASEGHPYTVVRKEWFDMIKNSLYSSYAIIDFIGVRNIISKHGIFPSDAMNKIKCEVEKIAKDNPNYHFLSCADNVIIKTNWVVNGVKNNFSPEHFIQTINSLITQIFNYTGIKAYAVISQGANYVNENEINDELTSSNHFFLPSISVPFVEAFEIDKDARFKIRKEQLEKCELYIERSFYLSLHRKFFSGDEPSWFQVQSLKQSKQFPHLKYIAVNRSQLDQLVNLYT